MKKRILPLLLALCMILSVLPVAALAAPVVSSGTCGDNLTWELTDEGTLTISGTGPMANYATTAEPWHDLRDEIRHVTIEEGVTTIGECAFERCSNLTGATIPGSITSIGIYAFYFCTSLETVTIPGNVSLIDREAFAGCSSLRGIHVDESNLYYSSDEYGVLFNKDKTTLIQAPGAMGSSYTIANGVTSIGSSAFYDCENLVGVTISDTVTVIGWDAFHGCESLSNVTMGRGVSMINGGAFEFCSNLTGITLPDSITEIGSFAFEYSGLLSVTVPASVTTIGDRAFSSCSDLTGIHVDPNNPNYSSDDQGVLFDKQKTQIICAPGAISGTYAVPGSVSTIGAHAFQDCYYLTSVTVTEGVHTIDERAFNYCYDLLSIELPKSITTIGECAFGSCNALADVYYAGNETQWDSINIESRNECLTSATIHFNQTSSRYLVVNQSMTWEEAQSYCERLGGHLATITSEAESGEIVSLLGDNPRNCYWIGLYRKRVSDQWQWVTGEDFSYTNWAENEPNDDKEKGECWVHLFGKQYTGGSGVKYTGDWNDACIDGAGYANAYYDLENFGFICEFDEYSTTVGLLDTDNDGLPDDWERNGADVDFDGTIDVHLEQMGADPNVPDLFVEVDWMYTDRVEINLLWWTICTQEKVDLHPSAAAMRMVYQQFADHGINLHIDAGPDSVDYVTGKQWGSLSGGNALEYESNTALGKDYKKWNKLASENFSSDRRQIFRYCIFLNKFDGTSYSGLAADIPGQYFLIADVDGGVSGRGTTAVAGTFMHELGHTLGLSHGGITGNGQNDHTHYKPNYLSIMNYHYQFPGLLGLSGYAAVDYSNYELPALDESNINEQDGVDPQGVTAGTGIGTIWGTRRALNIAGTGIDFNGDGVLGSGVVMDLNQDGSTSVLREVEDDWAHIQFKSNGIGSFGAEIDPENIVAVDEEMVSVNQEIDIDKATEDGLLDSVGTCMISDITPSLLYAGLADQTITVTVRNLGGSPTSPRLIVRSDLLAGEFDQQIELGTSEESIVQIQIPVDTSCVSGEYSVECELICENETVKTLTHSISVLEIQTVNVTAGNSKDLIPDDALKAMDISWESSNSGVASVSAGIVTGHDPGEAYIRGYLSSGDIIVCHVRVTEGIFRLYGEDRVRTAIAVADKLKQVLGRDSFDTIIIANGDNFADALTGSYLATVRKAPILLYRASSVSLNEAYIRDNLSSDGIVYILGGPVAVPAEVESNLKNAGYNVQRLYGDTRYSTNLRILEVTGVEDEEILICSGVEYADSLSASATGLPIVMVNSITETFTEEQIAFFKEHADNDFTIIGGNKAISEKLEADIESLVGSVNRIYGDNREYTSVAVAQHYFGTPDRVLITFSRNFPDGLCGGPLAHVMSAPLLLVNAGMESPAAEYVATHKIAAGIVLGGTAVVSDETIEIVFAQ